MKKALKIIITVAVLSICGLFVLRVLLFDYYPSSMKDPYMSDDLMAVMTEGEAEAFTQDLGTKYDGTRKGYYFFEHLLCIPEAGELQVTVRFNDSTLGAMEERYKLEEGSLKGDDPRVSYVLRLASGETLSPKAILEKDILMYNYRRLVFGDIDFETSGYIYLDVYFGDVDVTVDTPFCSMHIFADDERVFTYTLTESGRLKNKHLGDAINPTTEAVTDAVTD